MHGGIERMIRGGSFTKGPRGARLRARGHAGQDSYSRMGECFRLAMNISTEPAACSAKSATSSKPCKNLIKENTKENSFEADLAIAQKTERARRTKIMAENKGK